MLPNTGTEVVWYHILLPMTSFFRGAEISDRWLGYMSKFSTKKTLGVVLTARLRRIRYQRVIVVPRSKLTSAVSWTPNRIQIAKQYTIGTWPDSKLLGGRQHGRDKSRIWNVWCIYPFYIFWDTAQVWASCENEAFKVFVCLSFLGRHGRVFWRVCRGIGADERKRIVRRSRRLVEGNKR